MGGLIGGLFGNKSSSVEQTNVNPGWLNQAAQNLVNTATTISQTPYQAYTGQLVAPLTQNQQLAQQNARANLGRFADTYGQVNNYITQAAQPYTQQYTPTNVTTPNVNAQNFTQANIGSYMSPYVQAALQPQIEQINQNYSNLQNQANANAASSGNFGGSRQAVLNSLLTKQQQDEINGVTAQGYNNAYANAQSAITNDQNRNLQAQLANQNTNTNLGEFNANQAANAFNTNYGIAQNNRQAIQNAISNLQNLTGLQSNISAQENNQLMNTGGLGQTYNQNVLNANYGQFQNQLQYPYQQANFLSNILSQSPARASNQQVSQGSVQSNNGVGNLIGTGLSFLGGFL